MHITRRIATATLALALALGGAVGVVAAGLDAPPAEASEQAGSPWAAFGSGGPGGRGGVGTHGGTWS